MILTKTLWLGIAAASLIFLAAYGGMVSLAQVGIYGVAGMTYANLVLADGGAAAAWNPYAALVAALAVATLCGLGFGWIASRSEGIYFLMITLAFSVLVFYFFSQVTGLSGFGGVNSVTLPGVIGSPESDPVPRYLITLAVAVWCSWGSGPCRGPRSASAFRACATNRPGCARSGSTCGCTGRSRSVSRRSSPAWRA